MRNLKKNMQKLWYGIYSGQITIYERDEDGNIVYADIDGEQVPSIAGEIAVYNEPVIFFANIRRRVGGERIRRQSNRLRGGHRNDGQNLAD